MSRFKFPEGSCKRHICWCQRNSRERWGAYLIAAQKWAAPVVIKVIDGVERE
jgi:hypothetical protein